MKRLLIITFLLCLLLPSCAYMQTHKNVAEMGSHYVGAEVNTNSLQLYGNGAGGWYLAAPKVLLKRRYPVFYDTVYLDRDNDPTESVIGDMSGNSKLYMPISAGTATVLQRADGYAELASLVKESQEIGHPALETLPRSERHDIRAHVETKGHDTVYYVLNRVPEKPGSLAKSLSTLDKYTVDVVGTVVYNIAIPIMAPFRFFSEFLSED